MKVEQMGFRTEPGIRAVIDQLSEQWGQTRSQVINNIIKAYIYTNNLEKIYHDTNKLTGTEK